MTTFKISNSFISRCNEKAELNLPKYTSQLLNLANQNAGGTRPKVVGQMSELFPEYMKSTDNPSISGWESWYLEKYPDAINKAIDRIMNQVENLKKALPLVDRDMAKTWVTDLIVYKTFNGMYYQKAILAYMAEVQKKPYRLADRYEEAQGIDGYIGDEPVSIKPDTYQYMDRLSESIDVKIIYYTKNQNGITVNF